MEGYTEVNGDVFVGGCNAGCCDCGDAGVKCDEDEVDYFLFRQPISLS